MENIHRLFVYLHGLCIHAAGGLRVVQLGGRGDGQQLKVARLDPEFADMTVVVPNAHAVAHIEQRRVGHVRGAHADGEVRLACKAQEVDAVAVNDGGADLGDNALKRAAVGLDRLVDVGLIV